MPLSPYWERVVRWLANYSGSCDECNKVYGQGRGDSGFWSSVCTSLGVTIAPIPASIYAGISSHYATLTVAATTTFLPGNAPPAGTGTGTGTGTVTVTGGSRPNPTTSAQPPKPTTPTPTRDSSSTVSTAAPTLMSGVTSTSVSLTSSSTSRATSANPTIATSTSVSTNPGSSRATKTAQLWSVAGILALLTSLLGLMA